MDPSGSKLIWIGPRWTDWSKCAKWVNKWSWLTQMSPNWPKEVQIIPNSSWLTKIGSSCSKLVPNCPNWSKSVPIGLSMSDLVQICQNGSKGVTIGMVLNGPFVSKCVQFSPTMSCLDWNESRLVQMGPSFDKLCFFLWFRLDENVNIGQDWMILFPFGLNKSEIIKLGSDWSKSTGSGLSA